MLINLVMAEAAERVREAANQRQIEVTLEEPNPQVVVLGDRRQLTSAVYSLLENAVKFSPQASRVRCIGRSRGRRGRHRRRGPRRGHSLARPGADLRALLSRRRRSEPFYGRDWPRTRYRPTRGRQPSGERPGRVARGRRARRSRSGFLAKQGRNCDHTISVGARAHCRRSELTPGVAWSQGSRRAPTGHFRHSSLQACPPRARTTAAHLPHASSSSRTPSPSWTR